MKGRNSVQDGRLPPLTNMSEVEVCPRVIPEALAHSRQIHDRMDPQAPQVVRLPQS